MACFNSNGQVLIITMEAPLKHTVHILAAVQREWRSRTLFSQELWAVHNISTGLCKMSAVFVRGGGTVKPLLAASVPIHCIALHLTLMLYLNCMYTAGFVLVRRIINQNKILMVRVPRSQLNPCFEVSRQL